MGLGGVDLRGEGGGGVSQTKKKRERRKMSEEEIHCEEETWLMKSVLTG
jgi:hypothetical protein